jgi:threonine/homoserine/homoserine lactone efflux protein
MPVNTHLFALFLATTALVMIARGPDMLFVLTGVATSEAIHITVAAAGLSACFAAAPVAFDAMRIIGAAYLIWLGVQTIRHSPELPQ